MKGNYNNEIREGDALQQLKEIEDDSIDLLCTDPPYGYSFMGKEWDKAVVSVEVWRECLRVLKAGAFAFVMSAPRQDVLSRMIVNLQDAGFRTDFTSIYWTYASGFPKAANVSKLVDKRNGRNPDYPEFRKYIRSKLINGKTQSELDRLLRNQMSGHYFGNSQPALPTVKHYKIMKEYLELDDKFDELIEREEAERNKIPSTGNLHKNSRTHGWSMMPLKDEYLMNDNNPVLEQAKKLDGSYAGFQPKPAVEVVLTVMKPLSEKSFVDQALSNGKGVTWLDDCRIPYKDNNEMWTAKTSCDIRSGNFVNSGSRRITLDNPSQSNEKGRFPANLLVEDDALNDGKIRKSGNIEPHHKMTKFQDRNTYGKYKTPYSQDNKEIASYGDSGSYSRYFSLDAWYDNNNRAQFIITPKASPSERNKGLEEIEPQNKRIVNNQNCKYCPICNRKYPNSIMICKCGYNKLEITEVENKARSNYHPTVKPLKLMSYLITMGSRENDVVLDPFCGSGTTLIAAHQLNRKWIGIELNAEYIKIARKRIEPYLVQQKLL